MITRILFILIIFFFTLLSFSLNLEGEKVVAQKRPTGEISNKIDSRKLDNRAKILSDYLARYNSPMQYHAQDFIDAANTFGLDWKLLPSIAGVESTFGKRIPGGYNAYGWGIYGSNRLYFKSWRDGMFTVAQGLRERYINKGYKDPYAMNRIYAASKTWGYKVTYFMADLEKFSQKYPLVSEDLSIEETALKIAAVSAQQAKNN